MVKISLTQKRKKRLVRQMLSQGASGYNTALRRAALKSHQNIVDLLIEKGSTDDCNEAMTYADLNGHISMVELIQERMNSQTI